MELVRGSLGESWEFAGSGEAWLGVEKTGEETACAERGGMGVGRRRRRRVGLDDVVERKTDEAGEKGVG